MYIVKDIYQHNSKVLHTFVENKSFGQFLEVSSTNLTFYKTFNTEFLNTEIWFTDQNAKLLEKEDQINIDLVILIYKNNFNWCITYKMWCSNETRYQIFVKGYGFLSFAENADKL